MIAGVLLCGGVMRAVRRLLLLLLLLLLVMIRSLLRIRTAAVNLLGRLRGNRINGGLRLLLLVVGRVVWLLCLLLLLLLVDLRRVLVLV